MDFVFLLNYGVLGAWTISLIIENNKLNKQREETIVKYNENIIANTSATEKLAERIEDNTIAVNSLKEKIKN